jgi:hypothetical protein
MTTLDKKAAFFHVIGSHRWLAASGCAWNLVGPNASPERTNEVDRLLPNVIVMIRDCLLLHARSLIKFYRCTGPREDIVLCDFGIPKIELAVEVELKKYERPIEVHLLHLTDWRDPDYCSSHTPNRGATSRPDWDQQASVIAEKLMGCLKHASEQSGNWQKPFKALFDATEAQYRDKSYAWPMSLGEKPDVEGYLQALGL